jgi:hypothetical protein
MMFEKTKDDTEVYRVWYDKDEQCVRMRWNGYANSRQFREGTEKMFEQLVQHGARKVLGDIKSMTLIGQEDQQWLLDQFLPRAIREGFRVIALVQPDAYFNKVAVESVAYKINHEKLKIRFFNNVAEAQEWLGDF